ncbi:MAG: 23S rRNA (uracil(1939)-C(5))-methyltransferase RlmD [Ignavibacteriales bacterium]|nr:23S rRNA (uracil(1939)-C(5))-methyltransferase RlmD [Ignavibacteriales bacterium]
MKKGDLLELKITDYAFEGRGVAKIIKEVHSLDNEEQRKFVVFVDGSYPGDVVTAQITKIRKSYAEAKVKEFIKTSQLRIPAKCKYFGICGGCKVQNLNYVEQLKFKQEHVADLFTRIGGVKEFELLSIILSEKIFFYRNKMEYSFSDKRWLSEDEISSMQEIHDQSFALGLHIPGIYDKILDINECWLQSEISNSILNHVREFFKKHQTLPYSAQNHTGFLRNLVIKQSFLNNEIMINLVVSEENERLFILYKESLLLSFPQITTLVFNINKKLSQVAYGDYEIVSYGSGFIFDFIGKWKYRISANSFFQTNTAQAEKLFTIALEFAEFNGDEIVYDLYSGSGTIPIFISKCVKQVYGFENVESAIADAVVNVSLNNVLNFEPILTDLNKSFLPIIKERNLPKPNVIIADPPRSGMNPKTVKDILELMPKKIVYISCNPATQARDTKLLCDGGYKLIKLRPVDMFPHTYHIENVALLIK